ncbi:unnamed protein product [Parajaminaea phylloscopi]
MGPFRRLLLAALLAPAPSQWTYRLQQLVECCRAKTARRVNGEKHSNHVADSDARANTEETSGRHRQHPQAGTTFRWLVSAKGLCS